MPGKPRWVLAIPDAISQLSRSTGRVQMPLEARDRRQVHRGPRAGSQPLVLGDARLGGAHPALP